MAKKIVPSATSMAMLSNFYKQRGRANPVPIIKVPKANFMEVEDKARSAAEAKYPELTNGTMWEQLEAKRERKEKIEAFLAGAEFSGPKWIPVSEYNLEDFEMALLGHKDEKWVTPGYRGFDTFYDEIDSNCPVYPTHFMLKPTI